MMDNKEEKKPSTEETDDDSFDEMKRRTMRVRCSGSTAGRKSPAFGGL